MTIKFVVRVFDVVSVLSTSFIYFQIKKTDICITYSIIKMDLLPFLLLSHTYVSNLSNVVTTATPGTVQHYLVFTSFVDNGFVDNINLIIFLDW